MDQRSDDLFYGLHRDLKQAGYFATEHSDDHIFRGQLKVGGPSKGKLVVLSGIVGCGKSDAFAAYPGRLTHGKTRSCVSKSVALAKDRVTIRDPGDGLIP